MDLELMCQEVIKIAIDAGVAIMDIYDNHEDFNIEIKGDDSPLTKADKAANDIICERLIKLTPDIPIISEENKMLDYKERSQYDYCWMVDPLDGTKEFIKRNGEFTVNIALIKNGESIAGVVYAPALDISYWAVKDKGAKQKIGDQITSLKVNHFAKTDESLRFVCSRSHLNEATSDYLASFSKPETVAKGSSLKFLILATGDADIYPRLAPTMEWDTAAAHIILQEAGGSVIDQETGVALRYNKENLLNPYFIAFGQMDS